MKKTIWVLNMTAGKLDSGWGERHYYFSKYWIKKGYDVKIISGSYNHLFHNQPKINQKQNFTLEKLEEGITFCWVKIPEYDGGSIFKLWSMIVFAIKTAFLKKELLGKPDVILVSSMPIFPILTGWFLKRKYKVKTLFFEIRDLWPLTPMYLKGYSKNHPMVILMRWVEKFGYKKADYIISLLPNAHKYINPISKNPNKFVWIPNGIDESLLKKEELTLEIINQIPKNKFIIGYTGTMGMANALEYLIEASISLKFEKDIHFVFVGDGYLKEELIKQVDSQDNVSFISKINKNQVQSMLALFDVCFVGRNNTPLFDYGVSSNKFFDYMLAKKPIISSSNRIKDPVELSGCGFVVPPENSKEIADVVLKLKEMTIQERSDLGLKGYNYVKKHHNFNYLSGLYEKLF
ncbi:glycosyltransferase family 4 protein [Polaribacter sp. Hel1_85]|uniref:glycosyltransferase family 4 protein n=1 Tax=Polaribacter sp. Hel1_85 TaxID=1250005 RepID=UPI00052CCC31|nr:glycosyltransferase family 4 protein [Polaribacter sp. Hel1_85]KGL63250.1 glycosyltransferase, GT4 family [Polaribacter sp. Hel1_85]